MKKSKITTLSIVVLLMGFLIVRSFLKDEEKPVVDVAVDVSVEVPVEQEIEVEVKDTVAEQKASIKKVKAIKTKTLSQEELFEIKDKKIKTLLKLSGAQSRLDGMEDKIDEYLQLTRANADLNEKEFAKLEKAMRRVMNIEELRNRFAKMAHKEFSPEELDRLVEIYEQPEMQTIHQLFEKMDTSEFIEEYQAYKAQKGSEVVDEIREAMVQEIIDVTQVIEIATETTVNFTAALFELQQGGDGQNSDEFKEKFRQQMEERIGSELSSAYSYMFNNVTNEEMRVYLESHKLPIMQKMVKANLESMKEYFNKP